MGKQRITSFVLAVLLGSTSMFALFVKTNYDRKTAEAITETMVAQTAIEVTHNAELKQVERKKSAIRDYTVKMASIKELYRIAMQNIDGFGQESRIYQEIALTAVEIMTNIPLALKELGKRPYSTIACYKDMAELSLQATSAVNTFVNVVNNGKVSIKIKDMQLGGMGDGYNFLNRSDRYYIANRVLTDLREIKYKVEGILLMARFCNGISDILYALDSKTWCSLIVAKNQVSTIIDMYKGL